MKDYRSIATELAAELKRNGVDACDVMIVESTRFNTDVRLGNIEKLERSQGRGMGVRVFKNGATALSYTTDFADRSVKDMVKQTLDLVKITSADKHNGLAPKEMLGQYPGKLGLFDETLAKMPTDRKIDFAREAEEVGLKADKLVTNSRGSSWTDTTSQYTLANSDGFVGQFATTVASLSVVLLAEKDGVKQTEGWYTFSRFLDRLQPAKEVGAEAARRVVGQLGARKVKSQVVPVVVSPELGPRILGIVFSAINGSSIYRKSSFMIDKVGQEIASPLVTIVDDATLADAPGCRPFDGEGVKSSSVTFVDKGVLKQYACDSYAARRLGTSVTGTTVRSYQSGPSVGSSNLFMKNGSSSVKDVIGSVKNGFLLTGFMGSGFNPVTGDFSQGASGFWIENGEIAFPVQEITLAGNALKLLKGIKMVGNDLSFQLGSTATPTFLVDELTVGGA